jgi:hypothetical protein
MREKEIGTHNSCISIFSKTQAHLHSGMHLAHWPKHTKETNPLHQEQEPNVDTFELNPKQYLLWQQSRENIEQKWDLLYILRRFHIIKINYGQGIVRLLGEELGSYLNFGCIWPGHKV